MSNRGKDKAWDADERERLARELVETLVRMGYPEA
jgi:hypothetical protein